MKIPLTQIVIRERQRRDLGDVTELATSMQERGQIHSIGVNEKNELIWGRRRLEAARTLNWQEIDATVRTGLNEIDEQLIEFEEDVRRKQRTWQEECIACTKIFKLMRQVKAKDGENWTVRAMASFTGLQKSSIGYMLQVGDALLKEPRDDRVWLCENYTNAIKLLLLRTEKEVEKALMDRRKANPVAAPASVVQLLDKTQEAAAAPVAEEKTVIRIHGVNKSFDAADPDEDYAAESVSMVLAYQPKAIWFPKLVNMLRPEGWAVLWFNDTENHLDFLSVPGAYAMPWPLIWNKTIVAAPTQWPFVPNYAKGYVLTKRQPSATWANSASSVIACMPSKEMVLPLPVVDMSIRFAVTGSMAVVMPCNANPLAIAELGFVPIWFEPDTARFEKQVRELKAFYEENIPNVEVRLP